MTTYFPPTRYPLNPTLTGATISGIIAAAAGIITASTPALQVSQTWNNAAVNFTAIDVNVIATAQSDSGDGSNLIFLRVGGNSMFRVDRFGTTLINGRIYSGDSGYLANGASITAGGTQNSGLNLSSTANFGVYFGSGAPTSSQAAGSLYLRSDGAPQVNLNGTTGWLPIAAMSGTPTTTASGTSSTVGATDTDVIIVASGAYTLTLPVATGSNTGRILWLKSINAQTVNSASSNVVPLGGTQTAGTAIFSASAGKWAVLKSNGTAWVIMAGN